ncbi:MAG: hypothetical protein KBD63_06800 [Bacteriovoracaceae bacterium]|nr:hypothetical protein [Bacteriovoracaceae bacterium]
MQRLWHKKKYFFLSLAVLLALLFTYTNVKHTYDPAEQFLSSKISNPNEKEEEMPTILTLNTSVDSSSVVIEISSNEMVQLTVSDGNTSLYYDKKFHKTRFITLNNLSPSTSYIMQAWVTNQQGLTKEEQFIFSTLSSDPPTPHPMKNTSCVFDSHNYSLMTKKASFDFSEGHFPIDQFTDFLGYTLSNQSFAVSFDLSNYKNNIVCAALDIATTTKFKKEETLSLYILDPHVTELHPVNCNTDPALYCWEAVLTLPLHYDLGNLSGKNFIPYLSTYGILHTKLTPNVSSDFLDFLELNVIVTHDD